MIDLKVFEKFETENHLLPFSASRLKSYKNNKAKFFLDYVLGYPRISNARMERGKAVEFGLDFFYKNPNVQIDECVKIAKNFFKSATSFLDDDEEKQKQYEMIEPMLNQIFDVKEDFWNNLGTGYNDFFTKTQVQIETKISNVPFIGYCDYVFENENVVHVVDLKTKDKFMLTYDDKLQMAIYKKAYQERTNKQLLFSFLLVTGKQPRRKDQKVCEFVPFIPDYDYIGEAETHLKSLEHTLKLANSIDDLKVLFAPKLDDYEWKDPDAKKNRQEVWGI
jgi:hypothetical protein